MYQRLKTLARLSETGIINPEIGQNPFNINPRLARGYRLDKHQRIVAVFDLFLPFVKIARPGIISRRQKEQIIADKIFFPSDN